MSFYQFLKLYTGQVSKRQLSTDNSTIMDMVINIAFFLVKRVFRNKVRWEAGEVQVNLWLNQYEPARSRNSSLKVAQVFLK